MKVGDLVHNTADIAHALYGIVLELGHPFRNGSTWTVAHVRVQWPTAKATWEVTSQLEVLATT